MLKIFYTLILVIIICNSSFGSDETSVKPNWMLDEHTFLTLQVMNELFLYDSLNNRTVLWNNAELKVILLASSLLTDIWDKGYFITTQLYTFPAIVEVVLPFVEQMQKYGFNNLVILRILKQGALYTPYFNECIENNINFNSYPKNCPDNLSRTQGFHFDNLFTYALVEERWNSIEQWIKDKSRSIDFRKSKIENIQKWFVLMGLVIHAIQDFYCHSNWVLIHAYHNQSFDPSNIPTWEDFNNPLWRDTHTNYDTGSYAQLLQKIKNSNDTNIQPSEFLIDKDGSLSLNEGLQTGNCRNRILDDITCELMTCVSFEVPNNKKIAWKHRHPGQRLNDESNYIKILFNNFYAEDNEYRLAMQLTKRATRYWIVRLLSSEVIGPEKQKEVYSALLDDSEDTYKVIDPFTDCKINLKTEILNKIYGITY